MRLQRRQLDPSLGTQLQKQAARREILHAPHPVPPIPVQTQLLRDAFAAPLRVCLDPAPEPLHILDSQLAALQDFFPFHVPCLTRPRLVVQRHHPQLRDEP